MRTLALAHLILTLVVAAVIREAQAAPVDTARPDVRVLLDVSGSMRSYDPNNLRSDAISLLVRALPDDGLGGIWVFANAAVPVVEHGPTDLFWKRLASIHTRALESRGQRSNLPAAIEAATWDVAEASEYTRHIVLLSDGRIDVSERQPRNAQARTHFLKSTLPKLAAAGYRVHSLVLSDNADASLLRQLSQATGGHFLHARSGEQLAAHVQRVLNRTARPVYLPVNGQSFTVEAGLEELTIYRAGDDRGLTLIDPGGGRHARATPGVEVRWHDARGFDLLTLERPMPGRWTFEGELNGGILAFSDVLIRATEVPATLFPGEMNHVDFMLFSGGAAIVEDTFLQAMTPAALLDGERGSQDLFVEYVGGGVFRAHMADVVRAGPYVLRLSLQGRTFARQTLVPFDLANPVRVRVVPDGDEVAVWAELTDASVDYSNLTVAAQVRQLPGAKRLMPAQAYPAGQWGVRLPGKRGKVEVGFNFIGNYLNQKDFSLKTSPVSIALPLQEEAVYVFDDKGKAIPEPEPVSEIEEPPPAPAPVVVVADAQAEPPPLEAPLEMTLPLWFAGAVGGVNLLLLGCLYFLLRRPPLPEALAALLNPPSEPDAA